MEKESNPMQALCRSGCGFYGQAATDGLCSLCYKEALKKKQQPPVSAPSPSSVNSNGARSTTMANSGGFMETTTAQPTVPCLPAQIITPPTTTSSISITAEPQHQTPENAAAAAAAAAIPSPHNERNVSAPASGAASPASPTVAAALTTNGTSPHHLSPSPSAPLIEAAAESSCPAEDAAAEATAATVNSIRDGVLLPLVGAVSSHQPTPSTQQIADDSANPGSSAEQNETDQSDKDDKDMKKKKNRCAVCRKKVGLTGFECRCGGLFCAAHRYSDKHDCSFNYREMGAQEIRRNNPVVVGEKIQKI